MVMKGKISRIFKIRVFVFFNQRCNDDRSGMIRGLIENEAEWARNRATRKSKEFNHVVEQQQHLCLRQAAND